MSRSFFRKPSLKKSFKARTTGRAKRYLKRSINPYYGKKGMGALKNPKKSAYNYVYHRTSIGINSHSNKEAKSTVQGCSCLCEIVIGLIILAFLLFM